ncbi:PepSY domain-containing protein [Lewinella sp. JB7]|uniref:PepSY domain-containing protein n=1 Tax=Lewinella sp. JB7 TaxID=2962887 RepID=UPI0020CA1676|nr:PepSY domain-containing protein [Lewinella sp. JB7]MCP9234689.1 PepSY domain-containing protein [Lewinella sp. JB7]
MIKLTTTALLAFAFLGCAETAEAVEVPAAVQSAFQAAYPGATDVEWSQDDDHYEVEFEMNGEEMEVEYTATGEVMED